MRLFYIRIEFNNRLLKIRLNLIGINNRYNVLPWQYILQA